MKLKLNDLQTSSMTAFREAARKYVMAVEKQDEARRTLALMTKIANTLHEELETAFAVFDAQMDDPPASQKATAAE